MSTQTLDEISVAEPEDIADTEASKWVQSPAPAITLSGMTFDATEFEINGHRKIIEHYRRLLENDAAVPPKTRDMLIVRITEAERQIRLLEQKGKSGW